MQYSPEFIGLLIAQGCIFLIRMMMPRLDKVGLKNLNLVFPEKSIREHRQILKKSYRVLAGHLLSFSKIPHLNPKRAREILDDSEYIKIMKNARDRSESKVGVILPTLHFGYFELLVQCHALLNRPIAFLARGFGLPRLDRWWNKRREMYGNEVFTRQGGYQELVHRIKSGQDVGILFDQNIKSNHAVFIDFFGLKAATTKAVALAALRTGAPIVFATSYEIYPGRHKLLAAEVKNPINESGKLEEKVTQIMLQLHKCVEEVIRTHPENWFWIHRRFKTRPAEEKELIYENI